MKAGNMRAILLNVEIVWTVAGAAMLFNGRKITNCTVVAWIKEARIWQRAVVLEGMNDFYLRSFKAIRTATQLLIVLFPSELIELINCLIAQSHIKIVLENIKFHWADN
jgi:hypothetical protein